jgi:hypothetical protein
MKLSRLDVFANRILYGRHTLNLPVMELLCPSRMTASRYKTTGYYANKSQTVSFYDKSEEMRAHGHAAPDLTGHVVSGVAGQEREVPYVGRLEVQIISAQANRSKLTGRHCRNAFLPDPLLADVLPSDAVTPRLKPPFCSRAPKQHSKSKQSTLKHSTSTYGAVLPFDKTLDEEFAIGTVGWLLQHPATPALFFDGWLRHDVFRCASSASQPAIHPTVAASQATPQLAAQQQQSIGNLARRITLHLGKKGHATDGAQLLELMEQGGADALSTWLNQLDMPNLLRSFISEVSSALRTLHWQQAVSKPALRDRFQSLYSWSAPHNPIQ